MAASESKLGSTAQNAPQQGNLSPANLASGSSASKGAAVTPRLSAYYSDPRVTAIAFVKAVRASKLKSFNAEDISHATRNLDETDPTLARTVALMGKGPHAVDRWVVEATRAALRLYLPDTLSDEHQGPSILFDRVVRLSADELAAKDKLRRARAENLLRLVLGWFIDQRNLSPADALLSLGKIKRKGNEATATGLNRNATRLLKRAKMKQLLDLSLIAALFDSAISEEKKRRQEAFGNLAELRERSAHLESELQAANEKLKKIHEDHEHLSEELAATQKRLDNEKELRALERTQQAGQFRGFLAERLDPPLRDARDALEFDPPHVKAAQQRVEMAITAVSGELEKSNE